MPSICRICMRWVQPWHRTSRAHLPVSMVSADESQIQLVHARCVAAFNLGYKLGRQSRAKRPTRRIVHDA